MCEGIDHFAQDLGCQESRQGYLSKCDLCLDLRRHLVSRANFEELNPTEFFVQLRQIGKSAMGEVQERHRMIC